MVKSWTAAMREYFGLNGKPVSEFAKEIRVLSAEERLEFAHMLRTQAGIDCDDPTVVATK